MITRGDRVCPLQLPEFSAAASALYARLWRLSRALLGALAASITLEPAALLAPVDPEHTDQLAEGALTSTVLRVCHYHAGEGSAGCARTSPPAKSGVLFDEHSDSSLLTLSLLCPGCAGLQLRDAADGSWVHVEGADGASELDLEVHVRATARPLHNRHRTVPCAVGARGRLPRLPHARLLPRVRPPRAAPDGRESIEHADAHPSARGARARHARVRHAGDEPAPRRGLGCAMPRSRQTVRRAGQAAARCAPRRQSCRCGAPREGASLPRCGESRYDLRILIVVRFRARNRNQNDPARVRRESQ